MIQRMNHIKAWVDAYPSGTCPYNFLFHLDRAFSYMDSLHYTTSETKRFVTTILTTLQTLYICPSIFKSAYIPRHEGTLVQHPSNFDLSEGSFLYAFDYFIDYAIKKQEEPYTMIVRRKDDMLFILFIMTSNLTIQPASRESVSPVCHHAVLEQVSNMIHRSIPFINNGTFKGNRMSTMVNECPEMDHLLHQIVLTMGRTQVNLLHKYLPFIPKYDTLKAYYRYNGRFHNIRAGIFTPDTIRMSVKGTDADYPTFYGVSSDHTFLSAGCYSGIKGTLHGFFPRGKLDHQHYLTSADLNLSVHSDREYISSLERQSLICCMELYMCANVSPNIIGESYAKYNPSMPIGALPSASGTVGSLQVAKSRLECLCHTMKQTNAQAKVLCYVTDGDATAMNMQFQCYKKGNNIPFGDNNYMRILNNLDVYICTKGDFPILGGSDACHMLNKSIRCIRGNDRNKELPGIPIGKKGEDILYASLKYVREAVRFYHDRLELSAEEGKYRTEMSHFIHTMISIEYKTMMYNDSIQLFTTSSGRTLIQYMIQEKHHVNKGHWNATGVYLQMISCMCTPFISESCIKVPIVPCKNTLKDAVNRLSDAEKIVLEVLIGYHYAMITDSMIKKKTILCKETPIGSTTLNTRKGALLNGMMIMGAISMLEESNRQNPDHRQSLNMSVFSSQSCESMFGHIRLMRNGTFSAALNCSFDEAMERVRHIMNMRYYKLEEQANEGNGKSKFYKFSRRSKYVMDPSTISTLFDSLDNTLFTLARDIVLDYMKLMGISTMCRHAVGQYEHPVCVDEVVVQEQDEEDIVHEAEESDERIVYEDGPIQQNTEEYLSRSDHLKSCTYELISVSKAFIAGKVLDDTMGEKMLQPQSFAKILTKKIQIAKKYRNHTRDLYDRIRFGMKDGRSSTGSSLYEQFIGVLHSYLSTSTQGPVVELIDNDAESLRLEQERQRMVQCFRATREARVGQQQAEDVEGQETERRMRQAAVRTRKRIADQANTDSRRKRR